MTGIIHLHTETCEPAAEMLARADRLAWSARWLGAMRPDRQASFPPVWQCGLQAIELYLSAYLSAGEADAGDGEPGGSRGLVLSQATRAHLQRISRRRNYLSERFTAEDSEAERAEVSQLWATLEELDDKVRAAVAPWAARLQRMVMPRESRMAAE